MSLGLAAYVLEPGTVVLGKYRVERSLGAGGMGSLVAATHVELQDRVAIKVLRSEFTQNPELVSRFIREARAAASLRSEHVVRVFDVGRLDTGTPYMVMDLLEGRDLASGPIGSALPLEQAVDYVIQTCDAMIAAHARGIVHRDLKPSNLFLVSDEHGLPVIKVLDFGISKLKEADANDGSLTGERSTMGSPQYMAPEQVRSARGVDARADIWSLGTILFELITGRAPFVGDTVGAIFLAVAHDPTPSLCTLRAEAPSGLDAIVGRCLRKDPAERFQTAAELQDQLLPYGSEGMRVRMGLRHGSRPAPATIVVTPPESAATNSAGTAWSTTGGAPSSKVPPRGRARWRVGLPALGATLLVVALATVVALMRADPLTSAQRQSSSATPVSARSVGGPSLPRPAPRAPVIGRRPSGVDDTSLRPSTSPGPEAVRSREPVASTPASSTEPAIRPAGRRSSQKPSGTGAGIGSPQEAAARSRTPSPPVPVASAWENPLNMTFK